MYFRRLQISRPKVYVRIWTGDRTIVRVRTHEVEFVNTDSSGRSARARCHACAATLGTPTVRAHAVAVGAPAPAPLTGVLFDVGHNPHHTRRRTYAASGWRRPIKMPFRAPPGVAAAADDVVSYPGRLISVRPEVIDSLRLGRNLTVQAAQLMWSTTGAASRW